MSETDDEVVSADPKRPPPTFTLPIDPPIVFETGKHDTLSLKEPTVGQQRTSLEQVRMSYNEATVALYQIHLVSMVSGKPVAVIEKLPMSTFNRAFAYINYFLSDGRQTL